MMRLGRKPDELWVDYEARTLRLARAMIFKHDGKRWGDKHVEAYWEFLGHRVRGIERDSPSAASLLSWYRGLPRWQEQQQLNSGRRHGRHFPHLMNCERRRVSQTVKTSAWREIAMNRQEWARRKQKWCEHTCVAWASGRQLALPNL